VDRFAHCLVANLAPSEDGERVEVHLKDAPALEYRVIDYEISPLRTAGGHYFEDGRSGRSSGAGGADLLLAAPDGVPVVGEVKAPDDTSLFLALIQSLTYAAELLAEHQLARLQKAYPDTFAGLGGSPVSEVLILVPEDDVPYLSKEAVRIAENLLGDPEGTVARHIRRVTVAGVRLEANRRPVFSLRHAVESSYQSAISSGGID